MSKHITRHNELYTGKIQTRCPVCQTLRRKKPKLGSQANTLHYTVDLAPDNLHALSVWSKRCYLAQIIGLACRHWSGDDKALQPGRPISLHYSACDDGPGSGSDIVVEDGQCPSNCT